MTGATTTTTSVTNTAVFGDVGGHLEELESQLTSLGCDVISGKIPAGLEICQVGDLIHRGPHSHGVLALVDRFLRNSPGRWHQLVGNHEAQYLHPVGPAFQWPEEDTLDTQDVALLRDWWAAGSIKTAHHVPTPGPGTIITHAGVTTGFAMAVNQAIGWLSVTADDMTQAINDLPRGKESPLWTPGIMLTGEPTPNAGPLWAAAGSEVAPGWFWAQAAGEPHWDQVHGHSSVVDWDKRRWWCGPVIADQCTLDFDRRHATFRAYAGRTITGIDPGHGKRPARSWAPLLLQHRD